MLDIDPVYGSRSINNIKYHLQLRFAYLLDYQPHFVEIGCMEIHHSFTKLVDQKSFGIQHILIHRYKIGGIDRIGIGN